ncbi:hypothetical protein SNK04_000519 [Fusarium graminearum]
MVVKINSGSRTRCESVVNSAQPWLFTSSSCFVSLATLCWTRLLVKRVNFCYKIKRYISLPYSFRAPRSHCMMNI